VFCLFFIFEIIKLTSYGLLGDFLTEFITVSWFTLEVVCTENLNTAVIIGLRKESNDAAHLWLI